MAIVSRVNIFRRPGSELLPFPLIQGGTPSDKFLFRGEIDRPKYAESIRITHKIRAIPLHSTPFLSNKKGREGPAPVAIPLLFHFSERWRERILAFNFMVSK